MYAFIAYYIPLVPINAYCAKYRDPITDRILPSSTYHLSGTFWNSTADEIQVATFSMSGIEVYSPRDDSWHRFYSSIEVTMIRASVAIQRGSDSFIIVGGQTNLEDYNGDIFMFDDNGLSVLKESVLQAPRKWHVALPISKDDFTCDNKKK